MRSVLSYLAPIIVFLTAIIGSAGPSRRANVPGIAGLTPFGWSMLALASISFAVAIYSIYAREMKLRQAQSELRRTRSVAFADLRDGLGHLVDVLDFIVLMPYIASRSIPRKRIPTEYFSDALCTIDFKSQQVVAELENLILDPSAKLNGPYIQRIPFGTDRRLAISIIAEESAKAQQLIDSSIDKYAAVGLTADVFEAGRALLKAPYLNFMMNMNENWKKRSTMEDSISPKSVNLRMIGSGITGGSKSDYLAMIDSLERFRAALDTKL